MIVNNTSIPNEWLKLKKEQFLKAVLSNPANLRGASDKEKVLSDLWDSANPEPKASKTVKTKPESAPAEKES
jgi:hypothetical protein